METNRNAGCGGCKGRIQQVVFWHVGDPEPAALDFKDGRR